MSTFQNIIPQVETDQNLALKYQSALWILGRAKLQHKNPVKKKYIYRYIKEIPSHFTTSYNDHLKLMGHFGPLKEKHNI